MRATFTIDSSDQSVRKSLYDSLNDSIKKLLMIPDVPTYYEGSLGNYFQPESTIGEKRSLVIGADRRLVVSVDEERNVHGRTARHTSGLIEGDIFHDPRYKIHLMPIMASYDVTFNINFKSTSKNEVNKLIRNINFRQDQGKVNLFTGGEYHYNIPLGAIELIIDAYNTASIHDTEMPSIDKYLMGGMSSAVTVVAAQDGKQATLVSKHEVTNIDMEYDTSGLKTDKAETYYQVDINFVFTYERPDDVQCIFPLYLAGNPINKVWFPSEEPPFIHNNERGYLNPLQESCKDMILHSWMKIPWHLTAEPVDGIGADILPILTSDVNPHILDPVDGKWEIVTLDELPIEFPKHTLDYIESIQKKDPTLGSSIIDFGYYEDGLRVENDNFTLDNDGKFVCDLPPVVTYRYQIVISIKITLDYENREVLDSLREHPPVFVDYVKSLYPSIDDSINSGVNLPDEVKLWLSDDKLIEIGKSETVPIIALDTLADLSVRYTKQNGGMKTQHITTVMVKPRSF